VQILRLFKTNHNWDVHVCDNDCKDKFMNEHFHGTYDLSFLSINYNLLHQHQYPPIYLQVPVCCGRIESYLLL
jgi:hypothetical protein